LFFLFLAWSIVAINSLKISIKSPGSSTIQILSAIRNCTLVSSFMN
jgi:hypothetical protein